MSEPTYRAADCTDGQEFIAAFKRYTGKEPPMPSVVAGPITPFKLAAECQAAITRVANCEASWEQRPTPLTYWELRDVRMKLLQILERCMVAAESDEADGQD